MANFGLEKEDSGIRSLWFYNNDSYIKFPKMSTLPADAFLNYKQYHTLTLIESGYKYKSFFKMYTA